VTEIVPKLVNLRVVLMQAEQMPPGARYLAAFGIFAIAAAVRYALADVMPAGFPYLTFFPAIILTSFLCGTGPSILVAVLGFFTAWYLFIPPFRTFGMNYQIALTQGFYIFIAAIDIAIIDRLRRQASELRKSREQALQFAEERKTLLTETHHRIGNNLQTISSLLLMQARATDNDLARQALMDSVARVSTVATIQRHFHSATGEDAVLDHSLVSSLVTSSIEASGATDRFKLAIESDSFTLTNDEFLAITLILTECVNNAIEHAGATPEQPLNLSISLREWPEAGALQASVSDDGQGPPHGFDWKQSTSIGMKVIAAFARQLSAQFAIERSPSGGTTCRLAVAKLSHHLT
jgi:two-component system, sensor histidine kinase PdtaS